MRENADLRQFERDEDYSWAVNNLANTELLLKNELELDQKKREMQSSLRDTHLVQKEEKNAMWPNKYGDLNPLPPVNLDMGANAVARPIK